MNDMEGSRNDSALRGAFVAVTSLFFMWGFITVLVDALIPRLKEVFELTFWQAGLVQFAWFAAYGLLSIPGGNLISKIGYQRGILVGLATAGVGCLLFYPAATTRLYVLFLLALFVVAGGITILQVAANPYISVLGPEQSASARLNLSQAFNSFGTTLAPVVAASFLLGDQILSSEAIQALSETDRLTYYAREASAVQEPFVVLAFAFFALAGVAVWLKLGPAPRLADETEARIAAEEAVSGFEPVAIGLDRDGRGALLRDAAGRVLLLRPHGVHFAGRILSGAASVRRDGDMLVIDTAERRYGAARLALDDASAWVEAIEAVKS